MNIITLYFISGTAFIWGNIIVLLATASTIAEKYIKEKKLKYLQGANRSLMVIGALFILFSAPAIPFFYIQIICLGLVSLIFAMKMETKITALFIIILRLIIIGMCAFLILKELPYRTPLTVPPITTFENMYIIGDSISAGTGFAKEKTWVEHLQEENKISVHPFVAGGATLDYAIDKADMISNKKCLILLEIGGNDILRKISTDHFEKKLEILLKKLAKQKRMIIMFELPLPPFYNSHGYIQRRLARKYNVHLIPRRFMAAILTKEGTVDGLHLSNSGHKKMADLVIRTIQNVFPPKQATKSLK